MSEAETKLYQPSAETVKNANVSGMEAYQALVAEAEADYEGYWGRLAKELLHESGSIFVQISDENVHRVRMLMDEVLHLLRPEVGGGALTMRQAVNLLHLIASCRAALQEWAKVEEVLG